MFLGCLPCCDNCNLPPLPDAIEVEIVSGESQYASAVVGLSPAGGPDVYKYATAMAWTIPSGVFVLEQNPLFPGFYSYGNLSIGVSSLSAQIVKTSASTSIIFFGALLAIARQKTLADTDSPPTEEEMLSDDWLGEVQLDDTHPPFSPSPFTNITYTIPKATLGSGSANVLLANVGLRDDCVLGQTTRSAFANLTVVQNSSSICFDPGCVFPGTVQASARFVNMPRGATRQTEVTSDIDYHRLFPWYMYLFSRSGTYPSVTYQARASGKATATIESVTSLYGDSRVPMFLARGDATCAASECATYECQASLVSLPEDFTPPEFFISEGC